MGRPKKNKSEGLGDTVEKVFEATGISAVAKWMLGEDCGCEERKQKLNKLFPYRKTKCLTEDEYNWLTNYFQRVKNTVTVEDQKEAIKIYNRIFQANKHYTSCSECYKQTHNELKRVYDQYEK